MEQDFNKLIGRIVEKFGTRSNFCTAIGKSPEWLSRRLCGKTKLDSNDIVLVAEKLEIAPQDIGLYFFTPKVR